MPFTKELNKDFKIVDNHFELSPDYLQKNQWRFKKITGTKFFNILNDKADGFSSPFKIWCQMVGIYTEAMDPMLSKVGQIVEPKVREYVESKFNIKYKCYDPASVKWDVFHENKIFGGIPDGEPEDNEGNLDYSNNKPMLEVKTSSIDRFDYKKVKGCFELQKDANGLPIVKVPGAKRLTWFNPDGSFKISKEYQFQLGLYLYLRNINNGMFAVVFLKPQDYLHPELVDVKDREVVTVAFNPTQDIKKTLQPFIDKAETWYKKYILTGVSPEMLDSDKVWIKEVELIK